MRLVLILLGLFCLNAQAYTHKRKTIQYNVEYNSCPRSSADQFIIQSIGIFEKTRSLYDVKKEIVKNKWQEAAYLEDYKIDFSPVKNQLEFNLKCPEALAVLHVYEALDKKQKYSAILARNGKVYNPNYEHALRSGGLLDRKLPVLAIDEARLVNKEQEELAYIISQLDAKVQNKLTEMTYASDGQLSLILKKYNRTTSILLGQGFWSEKIDKLTRMYNHFDKKKSFPGKINLSNPERVVVRF
ncbi:MAG: hypothetical protein H6620_07645 [Halobacteriovoraceae bacterium]|nr:hypothetical protein [Halobacteriovoraceae bacterium]